MEGEKLKVVVLVKPRAFEIIEPESGAPGESKGV